MPTARDITGLAFKNGSITLLARIESEAGVPIGPSAVASASYTVYQLDESDPNAETAVAGHTARSLTVADILFDTLRQDAAWDADPLGYNFKHTLDVASAQAFAQAGLYYRVRYELTTPAGPPILVRFKLKAI